ncbi:uncharacterized protein LOC125583582 [Brassica napus]|uniref:uncharacterized protein LOC125583582 n=1 Tax=Brassica napus TaxID=3708 RepID=UPI00207AD85B|nr:uncharacterized protein LOC125583582 [Brassica napus]
MDRLERFEDLIYAIKVEGVSEDYLLCKLFKYSLAGDASHWLKQLPPGSLTSWGAIKNAFLCNFFDEARAEDLKSKTATFTQEPAESFKSSWIRFNSYQRDFPHCGFNEVQLLSFFYKGIAVQYQMALDASSNGNFNTRNPEEAVRVIENLASSSSTKNTDFERKKSASILVNDQMDEVKAKLDSVHKLLRKQVCLVEEAEAVGTEGRAEKAYVNFISGTRFQGSGNQGGNRNSYGNRGNFNQSSEHQKPYSNTYINNYSNNRGYGSSYYQKPLPPTQESKIEEMLDRVLEGQQPMTVDFNGKIDSVYTNLYTKFETLSTHVKMLEMQVVQTGESVKRHRALTKGVEDDVMRHHVNAIIEDDFWQVVKEEKLQEGDFEVESLMSFGGSHWCRPKPSHEHRSTEVIQN